MRSIYFSLLLLFSSTIFAQYSLRGYVQTDSNHALDYFQVYLKCPEDSLYRLGGTFINGYFDFSSIKKNILLSG